MQESNHNIVILVGGRIVGFMVGTYPMLWVGMHVQIPYKYS